MNQTEIVISKYKVIGQIKIPHQIDLFRLHLSKNAVTTLTGINGKIKDGKYGRKNNSKLRLSSSGGRHHILFWYVYFHVTNS